MALGGRIEIEVVPDLRSFDSKLRQGLQGTSSAAAKVGTAIGVALAAGTAVAAVGFKQAIDLGIEFQSNLNNLQAVSHATDQQMSQVAATAQRLGSDLSLPATSAAGAAEAMLELAKGGLTVEQSMAAAKGTLQLAAAAQIDGARAAEIQANALNAFRLGADQAGHVADVLANASNAASGEITDFAQSLAAVGAVANQFQISIDDTATALGLFANAGIKGSDAGTLLKTALLALANPSKPAQQAMETLGLTAFDATGKFVGLESIFTQLRAASGRLTPEMYAQASATVFGTDAVRLAGIAAGSTAEDWDKMSAAVSRAGGAQEVAAAKMKGLGGALQGLNSQIETAQRQVFDAIAKPLEDAVRFASDLVPHIGDGISSGLRVIVATGTRVGPALASGIAAGGGAVLDAGRQLVEPFGDAIVTGLGVALQTGLSLFDSYVGILDNVVQSLTPVADGLGAVADAAVAGDGPLTAVGATLGVLGNAAELASGLLIPVGAVVGGLVSGFASLPGPIQSVAFAMLALKFAGPLLSGLGSAFTTVTEHTGIFGRALSGLTSPVRSFQLGINQATTAARAMDEETAKVAKSAEQAVGSLGLFGQGVAAVGRGTANGVLSVRQFGGEMRTQAALAEASGQSVSRLGAAQAAFQTSTVGAVVAARNFGEQVGQIRAHAVAVEQPISTMGAAMRALGENVPLLSRMGAAFTTAAAGATTFGRTAGIAAAAGVGLRAAASGLIAALGGGWGVAITGAVIGLGLWQAANQSSQQAVAEHQATVGSLADALKQSGGVFGQQAKEALAGSEQFKQAAEGLKAYGIASDDLLNAVSTGGPALDRYRQQLQAIIDANSSIVEQEGGGFFNYLNETGQAAADALTQLDALAGTVQQGKQSYADFAASVQKAGGSLVNGAEAGKTLQEALLTLGDAAASADEKTRALGAALDALSGGQLSLEQAQARLNAAMSEIGESFTAAAKGAKDAGVELITTSGAINTTTEAGRRLLTDTSDLARTMADTAKAAFDQAGGMQNLGPATEAATNAAKGARQSFIDAARAAGIGAAEAEALANRYGLIPERVVTLLTAQGLDQVGQELLTLKSRYDAVPGQKTITVEGLTAEAETKLTALGFVVERVPGSKEVRVTAPTDQAVAQLNAFLAFASGQVSVVSIDADPGAAVGKVTATVQLGNGQTATMTYDARPDPATGKILATVDLGNGQTATMLLDADPRTARGAIDATVSYGNGQTSTIKVTETGASSVNSAINNAARDRVSTIRVAYQTAHRALGAITTPGPVTSPAYMAAGGLRQMRRMSAYRAEIVPPKQPRVIGDRQIDDEAFIPINRSGRSRAIFEETARRMGYMVARMYAAGGVAQSRSQVQSVAAQRFTAGSPDVVTALARLEATVGNLQRSVVVQTTVNNPLPETGSDSVAKVNRRHAAMGLWS